MLILKDIYLQNFMSISELSMSFEDDTIVAITGENGSGKSALLYAIAFAITEYRYGDSYKNYVKAGCETAHIELNAIFKGYPLHYDIDINGENKKKGQQAPTRRTVTYKDKIYLNSEYSQFVSEYDLNYIEALMFHFGNSAIIDARPSDRSDALKKIFQIEFDDIVNMFKDKQEILKEKNLELSVKLNELSARIFEKQTLLRTLSKEGLESKKQQLYEVNLDLSNIANVDEASIKKYEDWLNSIINNIENEKSKKDIDEKNLLKYEENLKNSKKIFESISDTESINAQIEKFENSRKTDKEILSKEKEDLKKKEQEASVLKYSIKEFNDQIKVCETGICHACGHEITPEHTEKIKNEKEKVETSYNELLTQIKDNKERVNVLNINIKEWEDNITSYKNDIIKKERESKNIEFCSSQINSLKNMISDREKNIERLEQDKERIETEKEELDKLKPLLEQRKELEASKIELENIIHKTETDIIRNEEKKKANNSIEKQKEERDNNIKKIAENQNEVALQMATTKESIEVFNNLFPNYILLQACKQLEDYINSIIQRMFPYMKVSLKIKGSGVNFYYLSESSDDEWLSVKMASKAQKKILSMAYQIALAKMYGLSCILLDEVDDAMSDENAKASYEFIASLTDFQQIIFISHRKESLDTMMNSDRDNIVMYKVSHGEYEQV